MYIETRRFKLGPRLNEFHIYCLRAKQKDNLDAPVFSERELFAVARPSVCLSVCLSVVCRLSSVTFVRPTQAVQIFGNISTAFGTLAIR